MRELPSAERVRALLIYDPATGVFLWRVGQDNGVAAGDMAGYQHESGRRYIGIDGRDYLAHRLAWVWMTGAPPEHEIDHRDCDSGNNRWKNLRAADRPQNCRNTRLRRDSTSGLKGATFEKRRNAWRAQIQIDGRRVHLGQHKTAAAAHAAYVAAARKYFGDFARPA